MFTSLFFLIAYFALIAFAPDAKPVSTSSPLLYSLGLYLIVNLAIFLQDIGFKRKHHASLLFIAQCELLLFLAISIYVFGSYTPFSKIPFALTLFSFCAIILYFLGLALHLYSAKEKNFDHLQMLSPFSLPFLGLIFLSELGVANTWFGSVFAGTCLLLAAVLFFPLVLKTLWKCKPIPHGPIKEKLDALCKKANFHCAGIYRWGVLKKVATAGIVGLIPAFRYVLFTPAILEKFSAEELEAVLAHEMTHSKRHHLFYYPFIMLGFAVVISFLEAPLEIPIGPHGETLSTYSPLMPIILFILVGALYFRIVFGYFSRLFEREADLAIFQWGLSPHTMIRALHHLSSFNAIPLELPNWHHYGIGERIAFLEKAIDHPHLIEDHRRKVNRALIIYFVLLGIGLLLLF